MKEQRRFKKVLSRKISLACSHKKIRKKEGRQR